MRVIQRVSDIVSANLNQFIDHFEDPPAMLKQAIAEMETATADAVQSAVELIVAEKLLQTRIDESSHAARTWRARALVAVGAGDDDGARRALQKQRAYFDHCRALQDELARAEEATSKVRLQIQSMHARIAESKLRLAALNARSKATMARARLSTHSRLLAGSESTHERFERYRRRILQAEAEIEAREQLDAEFDVLECEGGEAVSGTLDQDVEAELLALKRASTEIEQPAAE